MGTGKQIAIVAALIVVIAGAVVLIVRAARDVPDVPTHIAEMEITKVDTKTLEPMVLPMDEWEKLGERDGIYKNPDTGDYTMAPGRTCLHCEKWLPEPQEPADLYEGLDWKDPANEAEVNARSRAWEKSLKCPHCGKNLGF